MSVLQAEVVAPDDMATIIQTYNEVTERLKRSHDALSREVCRLREKLHEQDKELQRRERLTALGQMAAGVAHEIRNPLGGIGLYASLLERDLEDRPQQCDIVRKLSAGVRNVESIVSDILAFAGGGEPCCRPVALGEVLDDVLAQTAPQAQAARVEVSVDSTLYALRLMCDAAQIERALINLVFNAVDAAGQGGRVQIRAEARAPEDGLVRIVVADSGPGIAPELCQRIFDPFFTTKDTGTGLGLAIVHRIAEENGGSVRAGNQRGGGAAFVLSVPLASECQASGVLGGDE